jgi:4-hydroxybenzoate polyprenyltransferase
VNGLNISKQSAIIKTNRKMFETVDAVKIPQKTLSFIQLIRPENILPTTLLCYAGGYIVNPNILSLLKTPRFYVSTLTTLLVMSNSMILNDLYDINLDRIDHPTRPIVSGEIKIKEAIGAAVVFMTVSEFLSMRFLSPISQIAVHIANALILLYTPVLKRIPFIKNIACCSLISFSPYFIGISIQNFCKQQNFGLLTVLLRMIFFGSLIIEMFLDIVDIEGDRKNGIYTLPVIFGRDFTFQFANNIALFNVLSNMLHLTVLYDFKAAVVFLFLQSPLINSMKQVKQAQYEKTAIKKYANKLIYPLSTSLLYLCFLAGFKQPLVLRW